MLYDIGEILKRLPQRFPFLMVDAVEAVSENKKSITAVKNVTVNEPFFAGHFPGKPVMPGVMIIESLVQTCALLWYENLTEEERLDTTKTFVFAAIENVRFKRVVVPGDVLRLEGRITGNKVGVMRCAVKASVGDKIACTGTLLATRKKI